MTHEELSALNREISELRGMSLNGFTIYSRDGQRIRERDFDSVEEAQKYIDSEDERLPAAHKSSAYGVNIRPCIKRHPNWTGDENASAVLLEEMPNPVICKGANRQWLCDPDTEINSVRTATDDDRKTAIALAYREWRRGNG